MAGESGLGKTTFINTLFHSTLKDLHFKNVKETKTVKVERTSFDISEGSVNMRLSVIDTPGFGDKLNRQDE
jgi:septin family protein